MRAESELIHLGIMRARNRKWNFLPSSIRHDFSGTVPVSSAV